MVLFATEEPRQRLTGTSAHLIKCDSTNVQRDPPAGPPSPGGSRGSRETLKGPEGPEAHETLVGPEGPPSAVNNNNFFSSFIRIEEQQLSSERKFKVSAEIKYELFFNVQMRRLFIEKSTK